MPVLRAKKEIKEIKVGEILKVIATDVGTRKDFPLLAKRTGIEIVEMVEKADRIIWYLRRTE
jgi:tRNA 2-thiouridine synthesizing protein A